MSSLALEVAHMRVGVAEVNGRLDRMDTRMERIERRLELIDEPALREFGPRTHA